MSSLTESRLHGVPRDSGILHHEKKHAPHPQPLLGFPLAALGLEEVQGFLFHYDVITGWRGP